MNDINAAKRLKESAYARAEGEKILKVKRYASLCDVLQLNDDYLSMSSSSKCITVSIINSIINITIIIIIITIIII